ncbi:MAG: hypothetical protein A3J46_00145 [Candidatus Yanofskybacteria bacterium RIFCSPHIGHO2_02_FULL_41_11]|uniref:Uncharacterized protein n=1 Tax=Candidatus Yanofskybacteria bacterium RIFCSPHIGHO2_02_FULL_41_11 TaxID=1802675 RepID=A0A1F8F919_9BACT|nr:MAG: hypothetical protein A3J46_00145 [Candidatus Yanofskybacteria bacterium RIFCSPHIGHO2_02_FULL_41_11]
MSQEKYQPSPDEIKQAEKMMREEQVELSKLKERAANLAQELSEVSIKSGSVMHDEKGKMRELLGLLKRIEGTEIEGQVSDDEVLRFRADAVLFAGTLNAHLDAFTLSIKKGDKEELKALALIDSIDGGSLVMSREGHAKNLPFGEGPGGLGKGDPFHNRLGGWQADKEYEEDIKYLSANYYFSDSFILANRFRELRTAARMVQFILGVKKK